MKQMNMISKRNNFFIKKLNTYNFNSNYWGMSTSLDFKDCNDRIKNKEQIQKLILRQLG